MNHSQQDQDTVVSIDEVKSMLHEIAYVLHVTRKVKKEILEDAVREHSDPIASNDSFVGRGPRMTFRPEFTAGA